MDDAPDFMNQRRPTALRPLLGMTVLVVEDSRYACEALRLMCLRSGARIRRADSLEAAARHLKVYRPTVVIIDIGLPDGAGEDLISDLNMSCPRVGVILGTSGDPGARAGAMAAGADGFLEKPFTSLAAFQQAILSVLPSDTLPTGPRVVSEDNVVPDIKAYHDDIAQVAALLGNRRDDPTFDYVAQFLSGLALSAQDAPLARAASDLMTLPKARRGAQADLIVEMLADRLDDRIAI